MPIRGRWGMKTPNMNRWPFNRGKGRFKRKIPMRALSPAVARKRKEWAWFYIDRLTVTSSDPEVFWCGIRCIEFGDFCNNLEPMRIPIITKEMLADLYDDNVTIAQMRGAIHWKPRFPQTGTPCTVPGAENFNTRLQSFAWPIHMRSWLKKSDVVAIQDSGFVPGFPTAIDPMNADDWTDHTGVLREWNHTWWPNQRVQAVWNTPGSIVGVCSDTTRAAYTTPATSSGSQPLFNVPAIETDCTTVAVGEGCSIQNMIYDVKQPSWYSMNLNRRKPITLKEDDDLSIFCNWSTPRMADSSLCPVDDPDCGPGGLGTFPCSMLFSIDLKLQLQYG